MSFELPHTVGKQEVPIELFEARVEDEPFETDDDTPDYKSRLRQNHDILDQYLQGTYIEKTQPSFRLLTRLFQGKRTLSGMKPSERNYIRSVIGVSDDRLELSLGFYHAEDIVVTAESAVKNVEIGNRNYRWL